MSETYTLYNSTVMEHFMNPRNMGDLKDADGVGEVEAAGGADGVGGSGDAAQVVTLAGEVVDAADDDRGEGVAGVGDGRFEVGGSQDVLARAGCDFDEVAGGVAAVEADLARERVAVGRECLRFHQDFAACSDRPIEGGEQQMEVDSQVIRCDYLAFFRTCQVRQTCRKTLVVR